MIYVFLADGFEEIEALAPVDILRRAEADVKTIGIGGKTITGAHGMKVEADLCENELSQQGLEMIVLPGGPGTPNLENSKTVQSYIDYACEKGLWIGAICAAPSVLGHKELLKGRKAVCYPGYEKELIGAEIVGTLVCEDDNYITAKGPGAALEFGFALASKLKGMHKAGQIKSSMQCI